MLMNTFFKHFANAAQQRNGSIVVTKLLWPLLVQRGNVRNFLNSSQELAFTDRSVE